MAKFCSKCGNKLEDAAKFCPDCGTQTVAAGAQQVQAQQPYAPQYQQSYAPPPSLPKKKSKTPLIVGGAIALVILIAVVALSGREDSGIDPGGNDSPTHSAPGSTFGNSMNNPGNHTPDPASGSGIVGLWVDHPFKQDIDLNNYGLGSWIEFKSDGTYRHYWCYRRDIGTGTLTAGGIITESGRYSIEGDKIRVINRLVSHNKSIYVADSFDGEEYNNKPVADGLLPFKYEESFYYSPESSGYVAGGVDKFSGFPGLWLNMYPDTNGDGFLYGRKMRLDELKGIVRWPGGLPDYLCPAGYNGIVSCTTPTNVSALDIEKRLIDRSKGPNYDTVFIVEIPETTMDDIKPYLDKLTANGFTYGGYQYEKVLEIHGAKYEVVIQPFTNPTYNYVLYDIYGLTGEYVKIDFCFTLVQ